MGYAVVLQQVRVERIAEYLLYVLLSWDWPAQFLEIWVKPECDGQGVLRTWIYHWVACPLTTLQNTGRMPHLLTGVILSFWISLKGQPIFCTQPANKFVIYRINVFSLWASQTETVLNFAKFYGGFAMWTTASWCCVPFTLFSSKQHEDKQVLACSSFHYTIKLHLLLFLALLLPLLLLPLLLGHSVHNARRHYSH